MFHAATISKPEIAQLQKIRHVVRLGHVRAIEADKIVLDHGEIPTTAHTLHVDCSASALRNITTKPIFTGDTVTPQMVRPYQPVFSAAFIAHVELNYNDDADKNRLCAPVPLPNAVEDFLRFTAVSLQNQFEWNKEPALREWIAANRLDGPSKLLRNLSSEQTDRMAIVQRIQQGVPLAAKNLQTLLATLS
jgi:hypothetical protein